MKLMNSGKWRITAVVFSLALFFAACKKDDTPEGRVPAAGFMAFNLATDQDAVGFSLSGNKLGNTPLGFNNYTGAYLPINIGSREVRTFNFSNDSTLSAVTGDFKDSMYYSAFLVGTNGNYQNIIVKDELDSLTAGAGTAWVRCINAIRDTAGAPQLTLAANGENILNEAFSYTTVSPFKRVPAGTLGVKISNESTYNTTRDIALEENKVYTLLLIGAPGETDTAKTVQVKYVLNGTVTP
ncbi:MAG: DUF4397 domain-containing protein [Ferruginibacter sp.]